MVLSRIHNAARRFNFLHFTDPGQAAGEFGDAADCPGHPLANTPTEC